MSFSIEPKERDFQLKINGIGYQTLSRNDIYGLIADLKQNPQSIDLKGMLLFLRHDEDKCAELRILLENVIGTEAAIGEEIVEPITYPFPEEDESKIFADEKE